MRDYNAKRLEIPTNFIAQWFGFMGQAIFELTDNVQREPPRVQF
ncbi:MAG: LemA family protein [Nitrospiraceae bacterium]